MSAAPPCPVCRQAETRHFGTWDDRLYHRCNTCACTFLDAAHLPDAATERAVYDWHENDVDDPGYRRFLGRLTTPLKARLSAAARGLDYGCGPGPALAAMLREAGHEMSVYDPFYAPDDRALQGRYDFITCTEVAEHFHAPAREFDRLARLLRPGGLLAFMTCFQTDDAAFGTWHYRRDPTHVTFYREETMRHIAAQRGWTVDIPAKDVAIFAV